MTSGAAVGNAQRQATLAAVAMLFLMAPVACDLPVHCLRHEIAGAWRFVLGSSSSERSACGHARPDTEDTQPAWATVDATGHHEDLTVMLESPNVAKAGGETGTWTMIYDEGFEVRVGRRVFLAFSNFTFTTAGASKHNVSHCGDTMVGWYQNKDRSEFGCYYGVKQSETPAPKVFLETSVRVVAVSSSRYDLPLSHESQSMRVSNLNRKLVTMQLGWKARVMPRWNGKTLREINGYAGIRRAVPARDLQNEILAQQRATPPRQNSFLQRSWLNKPRAGAVPSAWDWGNVSEMSYLEPVMDQADCGSCYDASTMRMLTARHKINLNNTELLPWSINFPLFCSEYNQGCKGGYGFLTAKWSGDVGLIPATCMRYNTAGSCKLECDLEKELRGQKRYRADNHRYINMWYGNFFKQSPEDAIKEELYRNGPVVLSFEPSEDFMFYSEGIYKTAANKDGLHAVHLRKHVDFDQEWERVDHAVVAVGYGAEEGQKFWLIQNSWGADWGEDGYFRILRGVDESGIESIPEAADVVEDVQNGRQVAALFAAQTTA